MNDSMDDTGSWPVGNLQSQDGVRHQAGFVYPTPHGEAGLHASFGQRHEPQSHSIDPFSWTIPGGLHFQGQVNTSHAYRVPYLMLFYTADERIYDGYG